MFRADSLVASDNRRRELSVFDPRGRFVRTLRLPELVAAASGWISSVHPLSDHTFAAVRGYLPVPGGGSDFFNLLLVNWSTGEVTARAVQPPPIADSARGYVSSPDLCTSPGSGGRTIVVANEWSQQLVFLSGHDLSVRANVAAPIAWKPLARDELSGD